MKNIIKHLFAILLANIALTASLMASAEIKEPLPIKYFAEVASARKVKISPDGSYLAVIFKRNEEDVLGVLDTKTRKPISVFRVRGKRRRVGEFEWVSDERLVYGVLEHRAWDKTPRDTGELYAVNVDGSRHKNILGYQSGEQQTGSNIPKKKANYGSYEIIDLLKEDEKNILISFSPWKDGGRYWYYNPEAVITVYKLNVLSGKMRKVDALPVRGADAIADNAGQVRFSVAINDNNRQVISYKKTVDSEWSDFSMQNFEGKRISPISFTADNKSVYLSANVGKGTRGLYLFNLEDESVKKIYHNKQIDVSQYVYDYAEKIVVAVGTELNLPEYHYLNKKDPKAKIHKKLQQAFAGEDVIITSATTDGSKLVAYVRSDKTPGDYFLFETKKMAADFLFGGYPWIDPRILSTMQPFTFKTRDGTELHGYLTLPNNSTKKNLPLVVMPHGGPHRIRDWWRYDWQVQLLANRGYAVLQVNFRGSEGFGMEFEETGYGKWGTLMQDDLTDATTAVVERKIADPNKICIYGASYGGYAALMGTVREPDLYQCAIGTLGVYNLPMMFTDGDIADRKSGIAYLKEAVGDDKDDMERRSPVYNVDKIKAEIFLIHGAKDERAPIEQAESLMQAFDKIGKNYEWLELSNEGHGYYDVGNRINMYEKILAFLDKNIGSQSTVKD